MKTLLNNLGFSYLWNFQSISQLQQNMVIQTTHDQLYQEFNATKDTSSKLETLRTINKHFKLEDYITSIDMDKHRIALSRLRCSVHKLMIGEGRFRGIERNLRVCPLCPMHIIEDEYHFFLVCPTYRELRKKHLPKFYCRWLSKNTFLKSLNEDQISVVKKLTNIVYLVNEKQTFLLQNVADLSATS